MVIVNCFEYLTFCWWAFSVWEVLHLWVYYILDFCFIFLEAQKHYSCLYFPLINSEKKSRKKCMGDMTDEISSHRWTTTPVNGCNAGYSLRVQKQPSFMETLPGFCQSTARNSPKLVNSSVVNREPRVKKTENIPNWSLGTNKKIKALTNY